MKDRYHKISVKNPHQQIIGSPDSPDFFVNFVLCYLDFIWRLDAVDAHIFMDIYHIFLDFGQVEVHRPSFYMSRCASEV